MSEPVSKCCRAPVHVAGRATGTTASTRWYVCENCKQPCDLYTPMNTTDPLALRDIAIAHNATSFKDSIRNLISNIEPFDSTLAI